MTDETTEPRTHAEIEAEIYELVVLTKRHAERAHKQQQQIDQSLRVIQQAQSELKQAADSRREASQAIADAKQGIQQAAKAQIQHEARQLRRSSLALDWWAFAAASMFGGAAGLAGGWYIVTTWPRVFFGG